MHNSYTGRVITLGKFEIRERIARIAYARNGNVHNPTRYKEYDIFDASGRLLVRCTTLKKAKSEAATL